MLRVDFFARLTRSLRHHSLAVGMTSILSVCTLVGCGRSAAPSTADSETSADGDHAGSGEASKSRKKKSESDSSPHTVPVNSNRRMVADIPLDVFFDNPIAESKQVGEVASPAAGAAVATAKPAEPMPMPGKTEEKPASGPGEWAAIISGEDLQDEVKKIRLRLQENLGAIGKYNAHYNKEIIWDGAGLAALANIALTHPDKVSWKQYAGQIRDVAAEMVAKAKGGLGQKPFDATKKEFEKIDGLLGGNPPPGIPAAAAEVTFSDVASRKLLMHCIETGSDYMRANFQADGPFQKSAEDVAHTASVVAAYCKVVGTDGYGSADEPDYKAFLKPLFEANLTMLKAARDKDFATFSEANGRIPKYCSDCHGTYSGGSN
ncbi:MAG: hypothetical protein JWM11_3969 [Planctomycetaceae bacterium]|nr:hypothetical protein [Planctomycetaceae bacterium]